MNPTPQPSRTELIQRLADGELSDAERSELLQVIDNETPERWRDVALRLLGNRLIADGLRAAAPAPALPKNAPAQNVIAFPVWQRLGALAAALAIGLSIGFVVPRQPAASSNVTVFANLDDFKKAVGDAVEDSDLGDGLQNLLAAIPASAGAGPRPFAGHPEPGPIATTGGIESKVDQIQKNVADIQEILRAMQKDPK